MNWANLWAELWRQSPLAALIAIALIANVRGVWMSGSACQALRDSDAKETKELRDQRDEFKSIAFNCTGIIVERAQQSAKVNDEATEKVRPTASPKPVVAMVRIPVTPLTQQEKQAVQKPRDAEPDTLKRSLDASSAVLKKNDLKQAEVTKAAPAKKQ